MLILIKQQNTTYSNLWYHARAKLCCKHIYNKIEKKPQ